MSLLTLDLGNTSLSACLFSNGNINQLGRVESERLASKKENNILEKLNLDKNRLKEMKGVLIASVIPKYNKKLLTMLPERLQDKTEFLSPTNSPLPLKVKQSRQVGADIIANAVGAWDKYRSPTLIVDFGTATTLDLVADGAYQGSAIAPNLSSSFQQLVGEAALVSDQKLKPPESVVGRTTEEGIDAGFFRGFKRLIEGLIADFKREKDIERVVATGGAAKTLQRQVKSIGGYDPLLTHKGLHSAWKQINSS